MGGLRVCMGGAPAGLRNAIRRCTLAPDATPPMHAILPCTFRHRSTFFQHRRNAISARLNRVNATPWNKINKIHFLIALCVCVCGMGGRSVCDATLPYTSNMLSYIYIYYFTIQ